MSANLGRLAPAKQVRVGASDVHVWLQHVDALGFDRLSSLGWRGPIVLRLGSADASAEALAWGPGFAFGQLVFQDDLGNPSASVLGLVDLTVADPQEVFDALEQVLGDDYDWSLSPLWSSSILLRDESGVFWCRLGLVCADFLPDASELFEWLRSGQRYASPLHDFLVDQVRPALAAGDSVVAVRVSAAAAAQLDWEFGREVWRLPHLLAASGFSDALEFETQFMVGVGPWPVVPMDRFDACDQYDYLEVLFARVPGRDSLPPRRFFLVAGTPALAGRWDLQAEYHRLRSEGMQPEVAADVLLLA